jgi:AcrR family transcriptional regulator
VRRRHDRDELLSTAVEVTLQKGLAGLTFGSVANAANVPDRTVVYYFPTKIDLVTAVLDATGARLMTHLDEAVGVRRRSSSGLISAIWPSLTHPDVKPLLQIWLEVFVRAGAKEQPYADGAQGLASAWLAWLADRVDARTYVARQRSASRILARLDGALLLHHIGLDAAAQDALSD